MYSDLYCIGYDSLDQKYVLLDAKLEFIAEFDSAKEAFDYCDKHLYKYITL